MSYSYIGSADAPTSVFVAGKLGASWLKYTKGDMSAANYESGVWIPVKRK